MDTLLQLGWEVTTSFIDDYVSILVLMDTLLQLCKKSYSKMSKIEFQSLF